LVIFIEGSSICGGKRPIEKYDRYIKYFGYRGPFQILPKIMHSYGTGNSRRWNGKRSFKLFLLVLIHVPEIFVLIKR
jgi:hypothetical protein